MYPRVKVRQDEEAEARQEEDASYVVRVVEVLSLESHFSPRILVSSPGSRSENSLHPPRARVSKSHQKDPLTPSISTPKGKNDNTTSEDKKTNGGNGISNGCKSKHDPRALHARIPVSPRNSLTPSSTASKVAEKKSIGLEEDTKTNIRASSVPMPRAVISSPDNDGLIGSQNERKLRRQSPKTDASAGGQLKKVDGGKRTLPRQQTPSSPKSVHDQCKLNSYPGQHTGKVLKEAGNSTNTKGRRLSELPATAQRKPPFRVG